MASSVLEYLTSIMSKASSSAEEALGIKHSVVQQCVNLQRSAVQDQMSHCSQCASVMHLLAQGCESGGLIKCPEGDQSKIDRMAASCHHAAADWRKRRIKLVQMLSAQDTSMHGTGVQFTHGWDVVGAWEYRAVPSRLMKECNSDSSIRVCCAETQKIEGKKVVELGSSLLCGQSEDVSEQLQLHTTLQVITCGASSVLAGTCRSTLCVLPLHFFVASQIQKAMSWLLLPAMCAQPAESVVSLVVTASVHSESHTTLQLHMDSWCHPAADAISESVVVSNEKASQSSSRGDVTYQMGQQLTSRLSEMMSRLDEAAQLVVLVLELQNNSADTKLWTAAVMQAMTKLCDCFDSSSSGPKSHHPRQPRLAVVLNVVSDETSERMDAYELSEVVNSCMHYLTDAKYGEPELSHPTPLPHTTVADVAVVEDTVVDPKITQAQNKMVWD